MSRIVIVEDQEVLAAIYGKKFTAAGHEVQLAADGEAGLESINKGQPDLVVLDVMLPKLNGIEVLKIASCWLIPTRTCGRCCPSPFSRLGIR
jgi:DNA-binding response OmpR family regulator